MEASVLTRKGIEGFTIIELLIVIMVISVLASIAIVNFISYRKRSFNISARGDARNAFIATQAYYNDHPDDDVSSIAALSPYGFLQTINVNVSVGGTQSTLSITTYHISGDRTFMVNSEGGIN
jgi:prepilin-type N-terminal cleavage/methylation domain-containing protein